MPTLMRSRTSIRRAVHARGFSLVEVAISLAVVAVLMTGILVPVVTQIGQRKVAVTEKTLEDVRNALLGYAAANGRLPCPAVFDDVTKTGTGDEAFATPPGDSPVNGACKSFIGFVPGRTLGITPVDQAGYVLDGWGMAEHNRLRYAVSVDAIATLPNPFTRVDGIRKVTITEVAKVNSLLHVCTDGKDVVPGNCGANKTLTSTAVAVIWSLGPNAVSGGTSQDESHNPNRNNKNSPTSVDQMFVSKIQSDMAANPFDDVVTWLSFNTLVNRMVAAGQLP
jgi:prepilin-type N-terminal cleavage/methylation domain-containing protein